LKKLLLVLVTFFSCSTLLAQKGEEREKSVLTASPTSVLIVVDGELTEEAWTNAEATKDFWQNFPYDTATAQVKTIVRVTYDRDFIYVAAECFDELPEKDFIISSLRRDFITASDLFEVTLDPFRDKLNGFAFGVNPLGVQREGLIAFGSDTDWGWDNRWYSSTKQFSDHWTVEMAIPLKTLRFKSGSSEWNINFTRTELKKNEKSAWSHIGRIYTLQSLAFGGTLQFETPVIRNGSNISLIPYVIAGTNKDYVTDTKAENKLNAGLDAKVAISSSLNLDLTVNPDFSQVEVDRQITNLSRFELFFPERRQFFIENSDLFARFGFSSIRPFFSRRIGVGVDPYTQQFKQNPILYGARLSGRLNEKWRIGLMNTQTARDKSLDLASINYTVAALQRQVFSRSNIAAIFINKQDLTDSLYDFSLNTNKYNRIIGLDYNLASKNNRWEGKFFYHKSFSPDQLSDAYTHASYLLYNAKYFYFENNHEFVGQNYNAETGYVPRTNYWRWEPNIGVWFYPKRNKVINQFGPYVGGDAFWRKTDGKLLDEDIDVGWIVNFQSSAMLRVFYRYDYTYLFQDFDPTNTGGVQLNDSTYYEYNSLRLTYQSDLRKEFNYMTVLRLGQYFNGDIYSATGTFTYRIQPYGNIGLAYTVTDIRLPQPYTSAQLFLLGPSVDWAFTNKIFVKAVFQYNNQINNINTNIRFQWRFAPVSDFYIVYSDNYSDAFEVKSRGVTLKFIYWFSL
jgi:hypothetical protein